MLEHNWDPFDITQSSREVGLPPFDLSRNASRNVKAVLAPMSVPMWLPLEPSVGTFGTEAAFSGSPQLHPT